MNKISAIITVRLSESLFEAKERLVSLIDTIPKDIFDIVIIDYGTPPNLAHILDQAVQSGVRLFRHPSPRKIYSIGSARD